MISQKKSLFDKLFSYKVLFCVGIVLMTFSVCLFVENFFLPVYNVPTGSMSKTINVGDNIVINRLDAKPKRGDIVVFRGSENWLSDSGSVDINFVKRVIGTPGDVVGGCSVDGNLIVNGSPLYESYLLDVSKTGCNFNEVHLKDDQYWVMGDNRAESFDSRGRAASGDHWNSDLGVIHSGDILGTMLFVYKPLFS